MTKSGLNYFSQDRGDNDKYQKYLAGMDSVIVEKIASASAYIPHKKGFTIVDVGMASGTGTYILAALFPDCSVIGIDINPKMVSIANETYKLPNLTFQVDDGEKLSTLEGEKIIGFFNCSSIHHITSFNNYNIEKAFTTIKRQTELLQEDGVIVIRDFLKPESKEIIIEFPENKEGMFNSNLLEEFSRTARSLSLPNEKGFPLLKLAKNKYQLHFSDALEFIRRKDYLDDWEVELQEEYGYYSQEDFEDLFQNLGLRIIVSSPIYNPWILKNRYYNKFLLYDLNSNPIGYPPTNYVIAGKKLSNKGLLLKEVRQLPLLENSFIKEQSYRNPVNGDVYDVAQRPHPVVDVLPYYFNSEGVLKILSKSSYPRPIINQIDNDLVIDKKQFSGYAIESITAMKNDQSINQFVLDTLANRFSVEKGIVGSIESIHNYYTSPGGLDEKVEGFLVKLNQNSDFESTSLNVEYVDFKNAGEIRNFDAIQLLKSIQVGAVPDVRIEILLYSLLLKLKLDLGNWLSDKVEIQEVEKIKKTIFCDLDTENAVKYEKSTESACFLKHHRVKFFEHGISNSNSILEYVEPNKLSPNTVVTLPIYESNNDVFVGIEERFLPVPQIHDGSSKILTAPAYRLPKRISNLQSLENFILNLSIGESKVIKANKLGEKYFPSPGVTPEQVYPYVITLDIPTDELYWVKLDDLLENISAIKDGHLIICLYRLKHAMI